MHLSRLMRPSANARQHWFTWAAGLIPLAVGRLCGARVETLATGVGRVHPVN